MLGLTVLRYAPGTPDDYFQGIMGTFTCAESDNITFCDNNMYNISKFSNYADSCIDCSNITCSYGNGADGLRTLCAQNNNCGFGLIPYFQVSGHYLGIFYSPPPHTDNGNDISIWSYCNSWYFCCYTLFCSG